MATIQEINSSIIAGNFTNDQLNSIACAIKFARGQMIKQNRRSMTLGTTVKFTNSRTGMVITGTVEKIMTKNVLVNATSGGRWRVPANMIEFA